MHWKVLIDTEDTVKQNKKTHNNQRLRNRDFCPFDDAYLG